MTNGLAQIIEGSSEIVFFGGAGVSTESGIPDFRSQDGLYNQKYRFPPETILSHSFFVKNTEAFFDFYRDKMLYQSIAPNKAHRALARLEEDGRLTAVVTQNIDGLHTEAGSKNVFELHGSVLRNFCTGCGKFYGVEKIISSVGIPRCDCGAIIKPDVVLYEEALDDETVSGAVRAISRAEVLIVGGTSLNVYPAAGLLRYFQGKTLVLINKTPTSFDSQASLIIREPIGEALGAAVLK